MITHTVPWLRSVKNNRWKIHTRTRTWHIGSGREWWGWERRGEGSTFSTAIAPRPSSFARSPPFFSALLFVPPPRIHGGRIYSSIKERLWWPRTSAWHRHRVQLCKNYANRNCIEKSIYDGGGSRPRLAGLSKGRYLLAYLLIRNERGISI